MVTIQKPHLQATVGLGSDIRAALLQLTDAIAQQKWLPANFDQLPKAERFDAIIWTTAKQTILTAQCIVITA